MSDAKLWIDEVGCTATITGINVSYTMPLWLFEVIHDIIMAEKEKKVEVTHRDFDIQQELLDRYKAENAKLREITKEMFYFLLDVAGDRREMTAEEANGLIDRLSELGIEV